MGVYDLPQAAIRLVERSGEIDWWCSRPNDFKNFANDASGSQFRCVQFDLT